jgi:predicted dehydrogenase
VADIDLSRATQLAAGYPNCQIHSDWSNVVDHPEVEMVIVATTNDMLTPVTLAAVERDKPVMVEKPAARNARELEPLVEMAARRGVAVKVGFNHRFHPAFLRAREIWEKGELGELMYIRGRYGHGGRLGYEREWRANPRIAGGGELLDQGVHLIDLARWFAGEFSNVEGHLATYFWPMQVEDNGFVQLRTVNRQVAWLHVSCTEWKNLFSFEIFGRYGKLQVDGLGGSYGTERLTFYKMLPEMGPPQTTVVEYPEEDSSWAEEIGYFVDCIRNAREPEGNLRDAMEALRIVQTLYARQTAQHIEEYRE